MVVFASTAKRARLLAYRAGPSGEDDDYIDWRVRRFPEADGFFASEATWIHHLDAPNWLQAAAAGWWQKVAP